MTTATSIPNGLADTDEEVAQAWYVYGQAGVRSGMRYPESERAKPVFGEGFLDTACESAASYSTEGMSAEHVMKCGPFRADFYTAPLWFTIRDEPVDDLPPR